MTAILDMAGDPILDMSGDGLVDMSGASAVVSPAPDFRLISSVGSHPGDVLRATQVAGQTITLQITVQDADGVVLDLTGAAAAIRAIQVFPGAQVDAQVSITSPSLGILTATFAAGAIATAGFWLVQMNLDLAGVRITRPVLNLEIQTTLF